MTVSIRPARTRDVAEIRRLVDLYAAKRILLDKATVRRGIEELGVGLTFRWFALDQLRDFGIDLVAVEPEAGSPCPGPAH